VAVRVWLTDPPKEMVDAGSPLPSLPPLCGPSRRDLSSASRVFPRPFPGSSPAVPTGGEDGGQGGVGPTRW